MTRTLNSLYRYLVLFATIGLLAACGGGSSDTPSSTGGTPAVGLTPGGPLVGNPISASSASTTIQDIWLFQSIEVVNQDGTTTDVTTAIVESLQLNAAAPVALYGDVTFSPVQALNGQIVDDGGQPQEHIDVVGGILSNGSLSALMMIATPDTDNGPLVRRNDQLEMDFSSLSVPVNTGDIVVVDHFFAVTLGEEAFRLFNSTSNGTATRSSGASVPNQARNQTNSDLDGFIDAIELYKSRTEQGQTLVQAFQSAQDLQNELVKESIGYVNDGVKARLPAKAHSLLDGLSSGAQACVGESGIACVDDLLTSISSGAKKSAEAYIPQIRFDGPDLPPSDTAPEPFDPPSNDTDEPLNRKPDICTGFCGSVANDPHIVTFDGRHYSPQPVGEMIALLQMPQTGTALEMQWRFGPLNENRFASIVTAAAFGIGDTRITFDVNRDTLIAVNGEPVQLDRFTGKQLISTTADIVLADRSGVIELEHANWLFSIQVGSRHLNITSSVTEETGDVVGLLGNLDGNPDNDLMPRNGSTPLGDDATLDALYTEFLNSWRVTDDTSLFDYDTGENTATYTDLSFPVFPAGVATQVTLASEFSPTTGLDTRRAEAACRRAGISEEPMFGNCVADYVLSGSTEYIVGQQQALDAARRDRINRFGEGIDGQDLVWWQIFEGSIDTPLRAEVVSNGRVLLVRSRDAQRQFVTDAIDGRTGRKLWRLTGTQNECTPVVINDSRAVVQADGDTELGGSDNSDDLLLIDLMTGNVLDTWLPANGFLGVCSAPLQVAANGTLVLVDNSLQLGLSLIDDQIQPVWEHRFDENESFSADRNLQIEADAIVQGNNLFLLGRETNDDASRKYSVYQLDITTGTVVNRLPTTYSTGVALFNVGTDHLGLVQRSLSSTVSDELMLIRTPAANTDGSMQVQWQRTFDQTNDSVARILGRQAAYSDDGAFGIWARDTGLQIVIAEFDLPTGGVKAELAARYFNGDDTILNLQDGHYVTAPPTLSTTSIERGDAMIEATSATSGNAWNIGRIESVQYPSTLHLLDDDRLVMVVPLTDEANVVSYTDWAILAMGTRR